MGLYHEGYGEALARVPTMTERECLDVLDALWGRDNLRYRDGVEALRAEVRRQYGREFKNQDDPAWGLVEMFSAVHRARGR